MTINYNELTDEQLLQLAAEQGIEGLNQEAVELTPIEPLPQPEEAPIVQEATLEVDPSVEGNVQKGSVSLAEVLDTTIDSSFGAVSGAIAGNANEFIGVVSGGTIKDPIPEYKPHTGLGKTVREVTKLSTGLLGGRAIFTKAASKAPLIVKEAGSAITAASLFFDEHAPTMGNLVKDLTGIDNWLATDSDDGFWEGKLKQTLDAGIGEAVGAAFFGSIKAMRGLQKALKSGDEAGVIAAQEAVRASSVKAMDTLYPKKRKVKVENPLDLPKEVLEQSEKFSKAFDGRMQSGKIPDVTDTINPSTFENAKLTAQIVDSLEETLGNKLYNNKTVKWTEQEEAALEYLNENVSSLADLVGESKDGIAYQLLRDSQNIAGANTRALAVKGVINSVGKQLDEIVPLYINNPGDKDLAAKVTRLKKTYESLIKPYRSTASELGRGLNLLKNTGEGLGDLKPITNAGDNLEDWATAYNAASLEGRKRLMWESLGQGLNAYRISNMVGNTMTQLANITGNVWMSAAIPAEKIVGGAIADKKTMMEGFGLYYGMSRYINEALNNSLLVLKTGQPILRQSGTTAESLQYNKSAFELLGDMWMGAFNKPAPSSLKAPTNAIGTGLTFGNRLLAAGDEFFVQLNYRAALASEASQDALGLGFKPTDRAFHEFVEERLENAVDPLTGAYRNQEAMDFAADQTFSRDFGNEEKGFFADVGRRVQSAKSAENGLVRVSANLAFPFVRTPVRVFEEATNRVPVIPGYNLIAGRLNSPKAKAEAIGKLMSGSLLMSAGFGLAQSGQLTGRTPTNPTERRAWLAAGYRPYTVYLGGKGKDASMQIPLSRFGPWGNLLMLAGDANVVGDKLTQEEYGDAVNFAVASLVSNVESASMLKGFTDTANLISLAAEGEADETFFANTISQFIPMSSALRDVDSLPITGDPYMREAHGLMDRAFERMPGWGEHVPKRRDVLGNPLNRPVLNFFKKSQYSQPQEEIARLVDEGGQFTPIPRRIGRNAQLDLYEYHNPTTGQKAYDRYGELINSIKPGGMTLEEKLDELIKSPQYKELSNPGSSSEGRNLQGGKAQAIKDLIQTYRNAAREYLKLETDFIHTYTTKDGQSHQESIQDALVRMEQEDLNSLLDTSDDTQEPSEETTGLEGLIEQYTQ